jgi:hypothetical protein
MKGDELVPVLIVMTIFGTIGWIVQVIVEGYRRKERLKVFTDFHTRLIDRMGSAKEFGDFLQTQGGMNFLDTLSIERGHPLERIARGVQLGIVLTVVGLALFFVSPQVAVEVSGGYIVMSTIVLALGIGFLLSSVASYFLARTFGLTRGGPREELLASRAWHDQK